MLYLWIVVQQIVSFAVLFRWLHHAHSGVEHPSEHALGKPCEDVAGREEDGASEVEANVAFRVIHFIRQRGTLLMIVCG